MLNHLRSRAGALIEIDLRSLALFRIGVAITLLLDLASRVRDLDALYGARGVLPPDLARLLWDLRVAASPFTWVSGSPALLWTGCALLAVAAAFLALGIFPRLAAAVAWGLLAALQDRNPALYMSGDSYLLLLLMWCILLPTGARLSLRPAPPGVTRIRSLAGAGLLLQVMVVYIVTGLKKTGAEWFDGTALWYALSLDEYVTPVGRWLRLQTALIEPLSFAVKWVEIFGPLLVLSPWRNGVARLVAVGLFWALHLGLQASQAIGVFQLVGLAAWLVFLPSILWEWGGVRASTGSEAQTRDNGWIQPTAWSERLALVPIAYLVVLMAFTVGGVLVRGVRGSHYPVPASVNRAAGALHLQQGWAMFSSITRSRIWYLAPGRLADGSEVEVLRRGPLDWERPLDLQAAQRGFRWTMYLANAIGRGIGEEPFRATHPALLEYLCREWNARNGPGKRLEHVSLVAVDETVPRPGSPGAPAGKRYALAGRDCAPAGS